MKTPVQNHLEHILIKCITACEYCATLCLQEDNVSELAECIRRNRDCADICTITSRFLARNSPHTSHVMSECIEICKESAKECAKHLHDHCIKCAEIISECYEECEQYLDRKLAY